MKSLTIEKPNKSKTQLLLLPESQLTEFKNVIKENNAHLERIPGGYSLSFEKTVMFMKYYLKAAIIADEESFQIEYYTNAPEFKVKEFELKIIKHLKSIQ